jgi:hypothetical protein
MSEENKEERKPKEKPLLYFKEQGITIPPWCIITIHKEKDFICGEARISHDYQIVFNRGMESSKEHPVGETILHFLREDTRDDKYEQILMILADMNYKVIEL